MTSSPLVVSPCGTTAPAAGQPHAPASPHAGAGYIPSLDGLRAISVMIVFVAHSGLGHVVPGGFGVTVFFFLSGFLITTLMRDEMTRNGHVHLGHFYLRRVLRILPPFYLVLALAVIVHVALHGTAELERGPLLSQVFHYSNYWVVWHDGSGFARGSGVYWSLAVEEHFYLGFPLLFLLMHRLRLAARDQALLLWALAAAVLAWRCVLVYGLGAGDDRTYFASDTRIDSILFGCALAVWCNPVLDRPALNEARWRWLYVPAALAVILATFVIRDPGFRSALRYSVQGLALTVVFVAAIRFTAWPTVRLLNTRPMVFLGVLSYVMYLSHYVILEALAALVPGLPWAVHAALGLALTVAASWAIHVGVEKPCARLRRRLMN